MRRGARDFAERCDAAVLHMSLRANAVELVFDKEFAGHGAGDISEISSRRRQHRLQWMKQAHLDAVQGTGARAHRCFADVAAQHIGHRHVC